MGLFGSQRGGGERVGLSSDEVLMLYDRRALELTGYFAGRTGDAELAVELVAETFLAAFTARESCRADDEAQRIAWLYRIALNKLAEHLRRQAGERRTLTRIRGQMLRALADEEYERIEQIAATRDLHRRVELALAQLSDEQRRAVRARVVDERTYVEMAADLGITEQAARARVSRGLLLLRRRLGPAREGAG